MRGLVAFLFFCVAVASASVVRKEHHGKVADKTFLERQKNILQLYIHVYQPSLFEDVVKIAKRYSVKENIDNYTDKDVVKHFLHVYRSGMLPKGRLYSVIYEKLAEETKVLVDLLTHAKDFDTFYKTACWARENINEDMFVYSLNVAVLHRPDCQGIVLPAPYEVQPHYFHTSEVINTAQKIKMQGHGRDLESYNVHYEEDKVIISTNYSNWWSNRNEEQILTYFTEDIGWNSYHYYHHLDYPYWMNGKEYNLNKDRRGELYYIIHQQILARYYLERLSNGLGEIPDYSWQWPVQTGYNPQLVYYNGMEFPHRHNHFNLKQKDFAEHLTQVQDYERRIRDTIDRGYVTKEDGTKVPLTKPEDIEILGNIIESTVDSPNQKWYKNPQVISKMLLGNTPRPASEHKVHPSVLEHYQTSLRDPMWYQMHKRYMKYFKQFKGLLKPYTRQELTCPGVKIESVDVDKLVTYYDRYDSDLTNALYHTPKEAEQKVSKVRVYARQTRLNHVPFTVTTNIVTEKPMKVVVRMFLGPKYNSKGDELTLNENRENFFQLDQYIYELKSGKNTIQRHSSDFWQNLKDWTQTRKLYQQVEDALAGKKELVLDGSNAHNAFPDRLLLPKGWKGGMPVYFYVIVSPYYEPVVPYGTGYDENVSTGVGSGARQHDSLPFGYPFDRPVEETYYKEPNMILMEVPVYHKDQSEINQSVRQ